MQVNKDGPRTPAVEITEDSDDYYAVSRPGYLLRF